MIARSAKWQLQDAKNRLSEVIRRAREEGPQTITVRGHDAVTVTRAEGARPGPAPAENLWEFFQRSPAAGIEFDVPPLGDIPSRDPLFFFEEDEE